MISNGFLEFGLPTLVAFFVNLVAGLLSACAPPSALREKEAPTLNPWKEIEAGIQTDEAELKTPQIMEQTRV
jgi:hypothetical protein